MAGDWRPESESRCYWWLTQSLLLGFDSKARTRALVALVATFRTVACGPKGAALLITLLLDGGGVPDTGQSPLRATLRTQCPSHPYSMPGNAAQDPFQLHVGALLSASHEPWI